MSNPFANWTMTNVQAHNAQVAGQHNLPKRKTNDIRVNISAGGSGKDAVDAMRMREAYLRTGSVHRAALEFGMCGETFRKKLLETGFKLNRPKWSTLEIDTLKRAYGTDDGFDIPVIATALNRTYAAVACKADELGLCCERGKQIRTPAAIAHCSAAQKEVSSRPGVMERRSAVTVAAWAKNGHPKGMLGKHHTQESKDAISQFHTGKKLPREQTEKQMRTRIARYGTLAPAHKRGSWDAKWVEIGGQRIFARSRWESNYARYLEWMKSIGELQKWEHEPQTFWFHKIKRGVCSYLPDFRVTMKSGDTEWHEVKGWMDDRSKTKIRRMKKYYPKETLRVISAPWFKDAHRKLSSVVPGWEAPNAVKRRPRQ